MDPQNDAELDQLFEDELDERSRSLAEGAEAMLSGELTTESIGRMLREGHTIKGTALVMGYEGIARGGETCEVVWRLVQQGDLEPSSMLARTLSLLASVMPEALGADGVEVSEAIETVRAAIDDDDLLEQLPEPLVLDDSATPSSGTKKKKSGAASKEHLEPLVFEPGPDGKLATPSITYEFVPKDEEVDGSGAAGGSEIDFIADQGGYEPGDESSGPLLVDGERSVLDPAIHQTYDLGGLVGAVETWAVEESIPVNAGRLFRMINDVAVVRIDLESVVRQATEALSAVPTGVLSVAADGVLESLDAVRRASVELEATALGLTVVPVSSITATLPQLVKHLSKKLERDVEIVIEGEDTLIDRQFLDRMGEVIRQLVVNAVSHGLESADVRKAAGKPARGTITVSASREEERVSIAVSDDGRGIDWTAVRDRAIADGLLEGDPSADELHSVLYRDGFSSDPDSSEFTGSGSGLGRVTAIVEEVFGVMTLDTEPGKGTTFTITLPAHRALQRAQMFTAGGHTWGIPESAVVKVSPIPDVSILVTEKGSSIGFEDESVPYSSFAAAAGLELDGLVSEVMVIRSPTGLIALAVDEVLEVHEVATKDLGPLLSGSSVVSGVALLGGDDTVMLVDAGRLAERMRSAETRSEGPVHKILIVDDSKGVRQVVSGVLASHGFSTVSAGSVTDALAVLSNHEVDALIVDFSMPQPDGVALIYMVRQRYGRIPVVMLSGVASDEDRSRAERAGVDAFFGKADFAKGALVEKLRELIAAEAANGEAGSKNSKMAN